MRGVVLLLCVVGASAFVIMTSMPGRDCDRRILQNEKTASLQVVTYETNCGRNNMATEIALAPLDQADVSDVDPILVLPGKEHTDVKVRELGEQIAVTFPRGSKMVALQETHGGRPIRFIPQDPPEDPKQTAAKP